MTIWRTGDFGRAWDEACTEMIVTMYRTGKTHIDIVPRNDVRRRIREFVIGCERLMKEPKKHPTRRR